MEIFKTARIRLSELYADSLNFIKSAYGDVGQHFTIASPMGQLLQTMLHLGRLILYYIEDSTTELNIKTASRPSSIKGLAALTGHNPSRAMAARGTLRLTYNGEEIDIYGNTVVIPNYTQLSSTLNGLTYTVVLPGQEVRLELTSQNNYIDVNVVQGKLEYQQATGTGDALQSFNFRTKKGAHIDNFYVNVYVDGERWEKRDSILDMTYREKAFLVKTGQSGGLDLFFGNGYMGEIPRMGATILVEYLITDGIQGNIDEQVAESLTNWEFKTDGYSLSGEEIDLNDIIKVSIKNDIIFGTLDEPLYLTRLLAPHMSRSFTLINEHNYIYFLKKLNIFTIVDAIPGFATFEDKFAQDKYEQVRRRYENLSEEYRKLLATVGKDSERTQEKKAQVNQAQKDVYHWKEVLENEKQDDNTVYLFLIPDVNKRIAPSENYYNCSLDAFKLTESERIGILDLIEESGQRLLTVDNAILDIKYPRFVLNVSIIIFENFEFDDIREAIISETSDYFLKNTRRDRIPASDIVNVIENIEGVDSVTVWFDADVRNENIFGEGNYGIDDYGDIVLHRYVRDAFGNRVPVKDVYPLIRGDFENENGIYYEDSLEKNKLSTINIQLRGVTADNYNSRKNKTLTARK